MTDWQQLADTFRFRLNATADAVLEVTHQSGSTRIVPLVDQRIISVLGPDAEKFLQGQLTCDLREVSQLGSRLGAHCTVKGSMIALYRAMAVDDGFWLRLHHTCLAAGLSALQKYIIFSKAEARHADQLLGLGLLGPGAASLVEQLFGRVPSEVDGCLYQDGRCVVNVPGERFELWLPAQQMATVLDRLTKQAPLGTSNDWQLSEIQAAIPDLRAATHEHFIPQMVNLQALQGVSFTKGCYTGQEIVARLQHRGKLTKAMYLASVNTTALPQPGDYLHSNRNPNAGQILLAARGDEQTVWLLAVINKGQADDHSLHMMSAEGPELTLHALPYQLDPALFESKR